MRLLAAVPSVIYGLIGILVLVPFVGDHLISAGAQAVGAYVVQLTGTGLLVAVVILTVMITPIMIAIIVDALRAVPTGGGGRAGARRQPLARDLDDLRARRAARDHRRGRARHCAGAGRGDHALDGLGLGGLRAQPARRPDLHLRAAAHAGGDDRRGRRGRSSVEPFRPASTRSPLLLLFSSLVLSLAGWAAKQPLKRYGMRSLMAATADRGRAPAAPARPSTTRCAPGAAGPRRLRRLLGGRASRCA